MIIEMTTETPSSPMIKMVIGERSLKNCEICAVVLAANVDDNSSDGIRLLGSAPKAQ